MNYRYIGLLSGQMPLIGYVEPGKIIEVNSDVQEARIKEILASDKAAERDPTFEEYGGKVTAANRATVPMEAYGVYPEPEESSEDSPAAVSETKPAAKASTTTAKAPASGAATSQE